MDTVEWVAQGNSGYQALNPPDVEGVARPKSRESSGPGIKTLKYFSILFHHSVTQLLGRFGDKSKSPILMPCNIGEKGTRAV
jgi:hypothetical protein